MTKRNRTPSRLALTRRGFLTASAAGGAVLASPAILRGVRPAHAQSLSVAEFEGANIDWRMAEGERITVGVIPAGYFENLVEVTDVFEELTGISIDYDLIPPGEIRQKAVLDMSSGTGTYGTHAADPMYYPMYVANGWVDPLDDYLADSELTDPEWFDYEDILAGWRGATSIDGRPYGVPFDGEATIQVYRSDVYDEHGIAPAETLDDFTANAEAIHDPDNRLWGAALRGFRGAGQNMYIYPSIFRAFGGEWFDDNGRLVVDSEPGVEALEWYVNLLNNYAPSGVENWNWPDIADAFGQGTVGAYIDAHSSAGVINNPESSRVIDKVAYARWPKGPSGKRVTSIWNWSFPINAALSDNEKKATWLFIQWAASKEVQAATAHRFDGSYKRSGVNRTSVWEDPAYRELMETFGDNLVEATTASFEEDIDVEWRPRVEQWPAVGDTMATAIQSVLVGQDEARSALAEAQSRIDQIMSE